MSSRLRRVIKPPSRTPRPGLVEHRMVGLLTCGSWLGHPSRPIWGQWVFGVAHRLQLRGQSRTWRLLATSPYSLFIPWRTTGNHRGDACPSSDFGSSDNTQRPTHRGHLSFANDLTTLRRRNVGAKVDMFWFRGANIQCLKRRTHIQKQSQAR